MKSKYIFICLIFTIFLCVLVIWNNSIKIDSTLENVQSEKIIIPPENGNTEAKPKPKENIKIIYKDRIVYRTKESESSRFSAEQQRKVYIMDLKLSNERKLLVKEHEIMLNQLQLDPDKQEQFLSLLAEELMTYRIHTHTLDKQDHQLARQELKFMREEIEYEIDRLLGHDYDVYQDYKDKRTHYSATSSLLKQLRSQKVTEMDRYQQREMIDFMYDNKNGFINAETYKLLKEAPDNYLVQLKAKHEEMLLSSPLGEDQRAVFANYLNSVYRNFEGRAKHLKKQAEKQN